MKPIEQEAEFKELQRLFDDTAIQPERVLLSRIAARAADVPGLARPRGLVRGWGLAFVFSSFAVVLAVVLFQRPQAEGEQALVAGPPLAVLKDGLASAGRSAVEGQRVEGKQGSVAAFGGTEAERSALAEDPGTELFVLEEELLGFEHGAEALHPLEAEGASASVSAEELDAWLWATNSVLVGGT
jgi:hypothetical protein